MSATDFPCPVCDARQGHVCRTPDGIARWGEPHGARLKLHHAEIAKRHESKTLYVRVHHHAGGIDVDYSTDSPVGDKGMLLYTHGALMRRSYTATDTQRDQWKRMDEADTPVMQWESSVEYRRYKLAEMHAAHGYAIVYGRVQHNVQDYRVVNLRDGDETMLYSLDQCRDIIKNETNGDLRGSFGV